MAKHILVIARVPFIATGCSEKIIYIPPSPKEQAICDGIESKIGFDLCGYIRSQMRD